MPGPRNPKAAQQGQKLRTLLREILDRRSCQACGHKPPAKLLKAELPPPYDNLTDADIQHHLRLIARGVK